MSVLWKIVALLAATCALSFAVDLSTSLARHRAGGNLLADARTETTGTAGIARHVLRGPLHPEGANLESPRMLALGNRGGSLQLDLGQAAPMSALLVQTGDDDRLSIESSDDGTRWDPLLEIEPRFERRGLVTRHYEFTPPRELRFLRIRNERSHEFALIGALRAYPEAPPGWPDSIVSPPSSEAASSSLLAARLDLRQIRVAKLGLACLGAALLVLLFFVDPSDERSSSRTARVARWGLLGTAFLSLLGWWNFLQVSERFYDVEAIAPVDVYHYVMGAKYLENLGYDNLYHCTVVADAEVGLGDLHRRMPRMRELRNNTLESRALAMADVARCKRHFSAERWQAFQHDLDWFRKNTRLRLWLRAVSDHGYNASPAFAILGATLAGLRPLSDAWVSVLVSLDMFLYLAMWMVVWSTFGWRATCAALLFWGTNHVAGNWFLIGSYLRGDWLVLSVLGICCLRRRLFVLAGFLLVYATLMRIFPGFLLGGVALAGLIEMVRQRRWRLPREAGRVALGALAGALLLVALSSIVTHRPATWRDFVANTIKHEHSGSSQNLTLDVALSHFDFPDVDGRVRFARFASPTHMVRVDHRVRNLVIALAALAVLAIAVAGREPWVAAILGLAWLPFVAGVSNYYYAIALVFGLLLVRRPVLALPFALLIVGAALPGPWLEYVDYDLYMLASALFSVFFAIVLAIFAWDTLRRAQPER